MITQFEPFFANWERIKRLAGPNENWPGRPVYLYCSARFVTPDQSKLMRKDAEAHGWELIVHGGDYYLVGPQEG
jgi:hypothetical protein